MTIEPRKNLEAITARVIGCVIAVHRALGPGFVESIYSNALLIELREQGLATAVERRVEVHYKGRKVGAHVVDLLVDERLILELKTVDALGKQHYAQVRSYLRATGLERALLVNFQADRADFRRIDSKKWTPSF